MYPPLPHRKRLAFSLLTRQHERESVDMCTHLRDLHIDSVEIYHDGHERIRNLRLSTENGSSLLWSGFLSKLRGTLIRREFRYAL